MLFHNFADHNHHQFAGRRGAHHHVAQHTLLRAEIDERIVVLVCIITDRIANAVGDVVLQPALLDGQYLVESPRNVEAHGIHLVVLHILLHFLCGEPALVGECKLQLVAIPFRLGRTQDRRNLRQLNLADAAQIVFHLLLLVLDLLLVGKHLPFAAAANAIVLAERYGPNRRVLVELHRFCFGVFVFLTFDLEVNDVARHHVGDKDDQIVHFGDGFAFGSHIQDCYLL